MLLSIGGRLLSIPEVAYTAGILDGEGCICIFPAWKRGRRYHRLVVTVTNTNFTLLEWLKEHWGGHIGKQLPPRSPHLKLHRIWYLSGPSALPLLEQSWSYLVIKRELAENAITFIRAKSENFGEAGDPAALERRKAPYEAHQALMRTG